MPSGQYQWHITRPQTVNGIRNATVGRYFSSKQFVFGGHRWFLTLFPNETEQKIALNIASWNVGMQYVTIKLDLSVIGAELKEATSYRLRFESGKLTHSLDAKGIRDVIQKMDTLSITAKLCIYEQKAKKLEKELFKEGDTVRVQRIKDDVTSWTSAKVVVVETVRDMFCCFILLDIFSTNFSEKHFHETSPHQERVKVHYTERHQSSPLQDEYISMKSGRLEVGMTSDGLRIGTKMMEELMHSNPVLVERQPSPAVWTWKLSDSELLENVQNAGNGYGFKSHLFTAYAMKWCLVIYPNGRDVKTTGNVEVYLHLASSSDPMVTVALIYSVQIMGIDIECHKSINHRNKALGKQLIEMEPAVIPRKLLLEQIESKKEVCIRVGIGCPEIYDTYDKSKQFKMNVAKYFMENEEQSGDETSRLIRDVVKPEYFSWRIEDRLVNTKRTEFSFESGLFELYKHKWCVIKYIIVFDWLFGFLFSF